MHIHLRFYTTVLAVFSFVMLTGMLSNGSALAGQQILRGKYGDWAAYTYTENGNKVCYMASQPKKKQGNYSSRGEVFALITHRPADGTKNVFSYVTGYAYKPGADTTLTIGNEAFPLFTQDETAWAPDARTDNDIADAIKKGSTMSVVGYSKRGTKTTDTFSLSGSSAAYDRITRECR